MKDLLAKLLPTSACKAFGLEPRQSRDPELGRGLARFPLYVEERGSALGPREPLTSRRSPFGERQPQRLIGTFSRSRSTMSGPRILITGGAGFIGSAIVHMLNEIDCDNITIVDQLEKDEKWKNLLGLDFVDYLQADDFFNRLETNPEAVAPFQYIFHLGACSSTTESDCGYLIRNNFELSKLLISWGVSNGSRVVYASSAATYGDGLAGMSDGATAFSLFEPLNMYGYSKLLVDNWLARKGLLNQVVGLKYFNVFGPNEYHKGSMRSLVCKAYDQIMEKGVIRLFKSYLPEYPDGGQMRDFIYVKDAAAITIHLAESGRASGIFNVGSGTPRTWVDLARAIFAALEREPRIEFIEMPTEIRDQYQYYTCADISKLRSTGYAHKISSLEEAVADYVKKYLVPGQRLGQEVLRRDIATAREQKKSAEALTSP